MDTSRVKGALFGCLDSVMQVGTLAILGAVAGVFFLARGLEARSAVAYAILGGLVTLGVGLLFVALTLGILGFAHWLQSRYAAQERQRDLDNVKENLAIMTSMQRVQNLQNDGLLKQVREAQRLLPAPGDTVDAPHIVYDEAIFDELEMEE